jgi:hypothetical protein
MSIGDQATPALPDHLAAMDLPTITDEYMHDRLGKAKAYTLMLLLAGPNFHGPDTPAIVWEHGRRNMALQSAGMLAVVCPVPDDSELCGIGIFDAASDEVLRIMDGDPGVKVGVFTYEVHPVMSFPGSSLPA